MNTRDYPGVRADVSQLLNELHTFFLHKGYEAQNIHQGSTVVVQARKDIRMVKWAGFSYALTLAITVDDAGTHVTLGGQKWLDKAALSGAAALLSGGLLAVVPAFAAYKQLEISEEAWHVVTKHMARQTTPNVCGNCGTAAGASSRYCASCGSQLNSH